MCFSLILALQPIVSKDVGLIDRAVGLRQVVRDTNEIEPEKGFDIISKTTFATGARAYASEVCR